MPKDDGGLGTQLVGDKICINQWTVQVKELLGEGGFSFVYLVKDLAADVKSDTSGGQTNSNDPKNGLKEPVMVLKVTSIHSRAQRDIAEKEAKLLSRLSHPSIIKMHDSCYRTAPPTVSGIGSIIGSNKEHSAANTSKDARPQHMILMEYCEGGHALDVCNKLASAGQRFDLSALIIAFGQICNAVSYLHAQRPPIVHRDLKPVNFLVKNGAYKLCDFGSAVFGHVELKTQKARQEADDVIQKTTTQMFRAPEMVDLFMAKKLTQSTDVWALGGCLYSMAFLQNCFEEGSNLAILSNNYKIPDDNPYGDGLTELIDRMLTVDCKARADMTEVILCLSAIYSGRPLPPRKRVPKTEKPEEEVGQVVNDEGERVGAYRTDGQGIQGDKKKKKKKDTAVQGKKLASDSAAARRLRLRGTNEAGKSPSPGGTPGGTPGASDTMFDASFSAFAMGPVTASSDGIAFSTDMNQFADVRAESGSGGFGFDGAGSFGDEGGWGNSISEEMGHASRTNDGFPATFPEGAIAAAQAAGVIETLTATAEQVRAMQVNEEARKPRRRRS